jgi:hypothetical protein
MGCCADYGSLMWSGNVTSADTKMGINYVKTVNAGVEESNEVIPSCRDTCIKITAASQIL